MSVRDQISERVQEVSESGTEEQETLEQIEVEFGDTPFVKFYPTTHIRGTFPEDEGNPIIRFPDEENNDGRRDQGYLGLVLDDLEIDTTDETGFDMSDAFFAKTSENDTTEYRAVNGNDGQTSFQYDGDQVNISGDKYDIEERVTEIDGRAILVVDRTASVSVAKALDVNGATNAAMDETTGQPNGGLIEYATDDTDADVNRRYARNPELREELYGEEVGVLVTRRSEVDEDYAELIEEDERRDMMWYTVTGPDGETLEATTGEPVGYSYLEWRFDPSAGRLPEDQWEFVQQYQREGLPTDEETIIENVEQNDFDDEANTDRIVRLVQNGAGSQ